MNKILIKGKAFGLCFESKKYRNEHNNNNNKSKLG